MVFEIVFWGTIIPAATALAAGFLLSWLLPGDLAARTATALALVIGFACGYALLPGAAVLPTRHWHGIFYLAIAAGFIGPIRLVADAYRVERWAVLLLVCLAGSWLLVPTWSDLEPSRNWQIPLLGGYLFLVAAFLEPICKRLTPRTVLVAMLISATSVTLTVAATVSLTYGRLVGLAAASLGGVLSAIVGTERFGIRFERSDSEQGTAASVATQSQGPVVPFVILVGGVAFVGCVEPQPPLAPLLILPAAPLALGLALLIPESISRGLIGKLLPLGGVLLIASVGALSAWLATN